MKEIPIDAVPSQKLNVTLAEQYCTISIYTIPRGLFLDLSVDGSPIVTGALCLNGARLMREAYLGFTGDLVFVDTQGSADPSYTGLGSRFVLFYLEASDL